MKVRKLGDWKPRVLIFQGSPRDKDTCSNMESKTHKIVNYMVSKWSPFVNFEVVDLSVNQSKQPNELSSVTFTNPGAYHIFMAWPATDYTAGVPSKFIFNNNEVNIFTLLKTQNLANQNGYSTSYKFFISNKKQSSITLSII